MNTAILQPGARAGGNELAATVVFLLAAAVAIHLTRITGSVALVWPANALAAALLVRDGRALRWRAAFTLWCAGALANLAVGADSPGAAAAFAAVNVFEIWLTTWLLRTTWRDGAPVVDLALAGRILLLAGLCAPTLASLAGALFSHAWLGMPMFGAAATWWQSSVCGAALAAPSIYLFSGEEWRALYSPANRRRNLALAGISLAVTPLAMRFVDHSFIVVVAPLVVAALFMGGLGAALLSALTGVGMVAFWMQGLGPEQAALRAGALPLLPMVLLLIVPVLVGVAVDDRRRAIRAQQASERWMRQMLEQSPIGMCILTLDGVWEFANAALLEMLGYAAAELLGSQNPQLFVAEEFAAGRARALQLLAGERPAYTVERRIRSHKGEWIWTRCTTTLMRDGGGAPVRLIVQIESLAEQRRVEHELAVERERLATTLRAIADPVFVTDAAGTVTYLNPAAAQLVGGEVGDATGRRLDEILLITAPGSPQSQISIASLCAARDQFVKRDSPGILHLSDGGTRYVEESASPLRDPDGALSGIVVVLRDVRSQFEREQRLRRDAELDPLTGLANRRALEARVATVIRRCGSLGSVATLLMVDLDHFKHINDVAGHLAGDEMLRVVAAALRRSTRGSDLVARMGGDEFAIVLDDCAEASARQLAEKVLGNIIAARLNWMGAEYSVGASVGGASIGGASFTADAGSARRWIAAADDACYAAKRVGRGQISFARTA